MRSAQGLPDGCKIRLSASQEWSEIVLVTSEKEVIFDTRSKSLTFMMKEKFCKNGEICEMHRYENRAYRSQYRNDVPLRPSHRNWVNHPTQRARTPPESLDRSRLCLTVLGLHLR